VGGPSHPGVTLLLLLLLLLEEQPGYDVIVHCTHCTA
jgi:hypothetical protein